MKTLSRISIALLFLGLVSCGESAEEQKKIDQAVEHIEAAEHEVEEVVEEVDQKSKEAQEAIDELDNI